MESSFYILAQVQAKYKKKASPAGAGYETQMILS